MSDLVELSSRWTATGNTSAELAGLPTAGVRVLRALVTAQRRPCADDPEAFFPVGTSGAVVARQVRRARALCGTCPVRPACLALALSETAARAELAGRRGESLYGEAGVWGGLTQEERRELVPAWRALGACRHAQELASA